MDYSCRRSDLQDDREAVLETSHLTPSQLARLLEDTQETRGGLCMSSKPFATILDSPFRSTSSRPSSSPQTRSGVSTPHNAGQPQEHLGAPHIPLKNTLDPQLATEVASSGFFDSSSQPIDLPSFETRQSEHSSFSDCSDSQREHGQLYESGTPSYCGSWTSDLSIPASPSRFSHSNSTPNLDSPTFVRSTLSFENLYEQATSRTQDLSLDMASLEPTTFEEPFELSNETPDLQSEAVDGKARDMTMTVPRVPQGSTSNGVESENAEGAGGTAAQRPFAYTRNSSGFSSFLNYANTPAVERGRPATPAYSATRSTVFDVPTSAPTSESPSSSSAAPIGSIGSIPPVIATSSASTSHRTPLTKLEIPGSLEASSETAKPRPKGRGTLELERVLGLWAAKTPTSSFPSLSSVNASSPLTSVSSTAQPLFTQAIVSCEPESFVNSSATAEGPSDGKGSNESSLSNAFPSFGTSRDRSDSLAVPSFHPRRRRSKSDTDIVRGDSLGFPHSNLPVGPYVDPPPVVTQGPTFSSTVAPPTPVDANPNRSQQFAMNPNATWRSPTPPSSYPTDPVSALDLDTSNQHELVSRTRPSLLTRSHGQAGGPGYQQTTLLDIPGDGGRTRRSRSQGAGHRPSRSDDFSHFLPTMQQSISQPLMTTSSNGLLAPPQAQPPLQPPVSSPLPSAPSPVLSHTGSPYQQAVTLPRPPSESVPAYSTSPYAPSPTAFASGTSEHAAYPPQPLYSSSAVPDQGYLANQAALLASAALIAFNPTDPAHAAAAAAGYLPPNYSQFSAHPYSAPYGSPYGGPSNGLPALPAYHQAGQFPQYSARPSNGISQATRASLVSSRDPSPGGMSTRPPHPAYTYHSPLNQLPSPPSTSKSHSPAASGSGARSSARGVGRGRRGVAAKAETEEDADEDQLMRTEDDDGQPDEDDEDGDENDGPHDRLNSTAANSNKGAGQRGKGGSAAKNARMKRQVSEEGFSEKSKTTQATIDAAKRRRNANAVAKFVCDLCGETFTRRYNLRGHQRAHNGEKPYKCSYEGCDKAFARAHDCKRHELLHLGVRKYHCSPCKRDFVRLDALHRHHRSEVGQACVKQLEAEGYVFDEKGAAVTL